MVRKLQIDNKLPRPVRPNNRPENLPTTPGTYWWDHWKSLVEVTQRGRSLYVTPPSKSSIEIRVTPRLVGVFRKIDTSASEPKSV